MKRKYVCVQAQICTIKPIKYRPGREAVYDFHKITTVFSHDIARLYGVDLAECFYARSLDTFTTIYNNPISDYIILTYREHGDYAEHLKILKAEHLIYGDNG